MLWAEPVCWRCDPGDLVLGGELHLRVGSVPRGRHPGGPCPPPPGRWSRERGPSEPEASVAGHQCRRAPVPWASVSDFSLQHCEKCCFSAPVCGVLSQQPKCTRTETHRAWDTYRLSGPCREGCGPCSTGPGHVQAVHPTAWPLTRVRCSSGPRKSW